MKRGHDSSRNGAALVAAQDPRSPAAEAYRMLSTNIQFSSLDRPIKTVLVVSVGPDEGKSIVLANLAITIAEAGRQVVAVDSDLRRPALRELFDLPDGPGLTSMVLDESLEPPLMDTSVPNVRVLGSGPLPPNPAELLGSERCARVMDRVSAVADMVLFDAAPVVAVADATTLATRVDGVLLVVDSGRTRRDVAKRATDQLERVGAHLLGAVLTNVKPERRMLSYFHRST